jgi:4-azaleucine resistance transporter AzlC
VVLAELVLNARHLAYGISLFKRFNAAGRFKWYTIYALSDETFALLSSLPETPTEGRGERNRLMFLVALLDHFYWVTGSLIGAVAGMLIPFDMEGIGFSLTALFIVLMVEQMFRVRKPLPFIISAAAAVLAVVFLPSRFSILSALAVSIILVQWISGIGTKSAVDGSGIREGRDA